MAETLKGTDHQCADSREARRSHAIALAKPKGGVGGSPAITCFADTIASTKEERHGLEY
jgi:hypothetical protein